MTITVGSFKDERQYIPVTILNGQSESESIDTNGYMTYGIVHSTNTPAATNVVLQSSLDGVTWYPTYSYTAALVVMAADPPRNSFIPAQNSTQNGNLPNHLRYIRVRLIDAGGNPVVAVGNITYTLAFMPIPGHRP